MAAPNICMEMFAENGDYFQLVVTEDYELLEFLACDYVDNGVFGLQDTERFSFGD